LYRDLVADGNVDGREAIFFSESVVACENVAEKKSVNQRFVIQHVAAVMTYMGETLGTAT